MIQVEEAQLFMEELAINADYPITDRSIVHGEFADSMAYVCQQQHIDLVICGKSQYPADEEILLLCCQAD